MNRNDVNQSQLRAPTTQRIVDDMFSLGRDVASLVREPFGPHEAGIAVFMCSDAAKKKFGRLTKGVARHVRKVNAVPPSIGPDDSLQHIFVWMEDNDCQFIWAELPTDREATFLMAIFLGNQVCADLARKLTQAGCPTSIT